MSAKHPDHCALEQAYESIDDLCDSLKKCISYAAESEAKLLEAQKARTAAIREQIDLLYAIDLSFRDFLALLVAGMNDGSISWEKVVEVSSALKLPNVFALHGTHQKLLPRAVIAFGFKAKDAPSPPLPKPTIEDGLNTGKLDCPPGSGKCGRCGKRFELKLQQRRHVRIGHRVYCSYPCSVPWVVQS
jgi:hypothetical protein